MAKISTQLLYHWFSVVLVSHSFLNFGCKTRLPAIHTSSERCTVITSTGTSGKMLEQQSSGLLWDIETSPEFIKVIPSLESLQNKGRLCTPKHLCWGFPGLFMYSTNIYDMPTMCWALFQALLIVKTDYHHATFYWRETHRKPYILIWKLYVL